MKQNQKVVTTQEITPEMINAIENLNPGITEPIPAGAKGVVRAIMSSNSMPNNLTHMVRFEHFYGVTRVVWINPDWLAAAPDAKNP